MQRHLVLALHSISHFPAGNSCVPAWVRGSAAEGTEWILQMNGKKKTSTQVVHEYFLLMLHRFLTH